MKIAIALAGLLAVCLAAPAAKDNKGKMMGVVNGFFAGIDADKDGFMSQAEFNAAMANYDADGNGQTTVDEYVVRAKAVFGYDDFQANAMFRISDMNMDGVLNDMDFVRMRSEMDSNNDGQVTKQEFGAALMATFRVLPYVRLLVAADQDHDGKASISALKIVMMGFDANKDGEISEAELVPVVGDANVAKGIITLIDADKNMKTSIAGEFAGMLSSLDADKDGEVSIQEMMGIMARFPRGN